MTIGTITVAQTDEGAYIISDDGIGAYGSGPTLEEAIRDYVTAVIVFIDVREQDEP